jgi:uncharacterized protein (DUF2141 family)
MLPGSRLPFRGFPLAAALLASGLFGDLSASSVSGTVVTRQGSRVVPVSRASVLAREAAGSDILAVARTDNQGRFLIADLPSTRVALSVQKHGFFTRLVNGRESESVVLDCSAPEDCADVKFELGPAAVISGIVVDELGEPIHELDLFAGLGDSAPGESSDRAVYARTDDRGHFRFAGLKPGRYRVKAAGESRGMFGEQRIESDPVDVEVGEGGEVRGLQIQVRLPVERQKTYTLSGKVTGVDLSREGAHLVQILGPLRDSSGRSPGGRSYNRPVRQDGVFSFDELETGRYALAYSYRTHRDDERAADARPLGVVEVSGDTAGLVLTPLPPTGFSGTVKFETRRPPRPVQLSLSSSEEGILPIGDRAEPPDFRFRFTSLTPGKYRINIYRGWRGDIDFYVKGFRRGNELSPAGELAVAEGVVDSFDIVVSDEMARVYGRVKAATEPGTGQAIRKGAQFQVALSGPNRAMRVTQADQYGRFHFDDIVPGKYRICGWASLAGREAPDEKTWEQAGSAVREFTIEAGSDVEIDLTAVP